MLENIQKITQVLFHIVTILIAVLTYRGAKRGLLNTVNTEYQKKVISKLEQLSDKLIEEFDVESKNYWANNDYLPDVVASINKLFIKNRAQILEERELRFPVPVNNQTSYLKTLLIKTKSDPFIPMSLKSKISGLLSDRIKTVNSVYSDVFKQYKTDLAFGKYMDIKSPTDNYKELANAINDELSKKEFDIESVEEKVHKLREDIQSYFLNYVPMKDKKYY